MQKGRKLNKWTEEEDRYIIKNYLVIPNKEIAENIGKRAKDIDNRVARLKSKGKIEKIRNKEYPAPPVELTIKQCKHSLSLGSKYVIKGTPKSTEKDMTFRGTLIQTTDRLFVLKGKYYCRAFTYIEVSTNEYILEKVS